MNAIGAIGTPAHAMHSMAYLSLWCVTVSTVGEPVVYPTQWQWSVLLLLIGIFTPTQQRATAACGTLGVYVQVIFADVLDIFFVQTIPLWCVGITFVSHVWYGVLTSPCNFPSKSSDKSPT